MSEPNRIFLTELNQSHSEPNQFFFQKAKLKYKKNFRTSLVIASTQ